MPLADKKNDLAQFTGSENWYRHALNARITYTDGAKFVAENGGTNGAYWLLDAIVSYQYEPKVKAEEFQVWKLVVADGKGVLTLSDGNDSPPIVTQDIEFTDFDLPEIKLWLVNGVILLPSEY